MEIIAESCGICRGAERMRKRPGRPRDKVYEKTEGLVPFTIDEYRKSDGMGKRLFRKSMCLQRMQAADNEAKKSHERLRVMCEGHGVEFSWYTARKYSKQKRSIEQGLIIALGAKLYNPHEMCERCMKIQQLLDDQAYYWRMAKKWEKIMQKGVKPSKR